MHVAESCRTNIQRKGQVKAQPPKSLESKVPRENPVDMGRTCKVSTEKPQGNL